ncbi:MAG: hypothetical protein ACK4ND_12030 [Cytophagaceae bacterium]
MVKKSLIIILCVTIAIGSCKKKEIDEPDTHDSFAVPEDMGNGVFSLKSSVSELLVDKDQGGRISSFKFNGIELLSSKAVNPTNWGSTFWPSPQSQWNWPPPPILDRHPYIGIVEGHSLVLLSARDSVKTNYQFGKSLSANTTRDYYNIGYSIKNTHTALQNVAAWEITRVPSGGITFFPAGDTLWGDMKNLVSNVSGIIWYNYDAEAFTGDKKLFADGKEGWIAHARDGLVFIKTYKDIQVADFAPSEAEIEIYINGGKTYQEIEQQGKYTGLDPNASLDWQVKWFVRKLPDNVNSELGSASLVDFVREVVQ